MLCFMDLCAQDCECRGVIEVSCRDAISKYGSFRNSSDLADVALTSEVIKVIKRVQAVAGNAASSEIDAYCGLQTRQAVMALAPRSLPQEVVETAANFASLKAASNARQGVEKHVREETERLFIDVVKETKRLARPTVQQRSLSHLSDVSMDIAVAACNPSVVVTQPLSLNKSPTYLTMSTLLHLWRNTDCQDNNVKRLFLFPIADSGDTQVNIALCVACRRPWTQTVDQSIFEQTDGVFEDPFRRVHQQCTVAHNCAQGRMLVEPVADAAVVLPSENTGPSVFVPFLRPHNTVREGPTGIEMVKLSSIFPFLSDQPSDKTPMTQYSVLHGYCSLVLREWLYFLLRGQPYEAAAAAASVTTVAGVSIGSLQLLLERAMVLSSFTALLPDYLRCKIPSLLAQKVCVCCRKHGSQNGFFVFNTTKSNGSDHKLINLAELLHQSESFRTR